MVPEVIGDARRRGDEAVRRLREESERRVERERRRRSFASWCALATLAGGISLAALNTHDARLQEQEAPRAEAARQPEADQPVISEACMARSKALEAALLELNDSLSRATSDKEVARLRAQAATRWAAIVKAAAERGCAPTVKRSSAPVKYHHTRGCVLTRGDPLEGAF